MKKCPVCNRTYADETLSFCLEDGSLLSAPFNLYEEQETVVRHNLSALPPTRFYSPETARQREIPTVVSAQNKFSAYRQQESQIHGSVSQSFAYSIGKAFKEFSLGRLLFILSFIVLWAIYTGSIIPLAIGLCVAVIYLILLFLKRK